MAGQAVENSRLRDYVLLLVSGKEPGKHLFVQKDRPAWQAGRLNLPGGKIEPGETPVEAARRELQEETGLDAVKIQLSGEMPIDHGTIYCFRCVVENEEIVPREGETEIAEWMDWAEAQHDPRLIQNLRLIVPLAATGSTGWELPDRPDDTEFLVRF